MYFAKIKNFDDSYMLIANREEKGKLDKIPDIYKGYIGREFPSFKESERGYLLNTYIESIIINVPLDLHNLKRYHNDKRIAKLQGEFMYITTRIEDFSEIPLIKREED